MSTVIPGSASLTAFVLASLALAILPGPAVFYIVTRTLSQGRRVGLASVAGVSLGSLGNAIAAAVGLGALFAISAVAFLVVKYAGAAYLIWLGINLLRRPGARPAAAAVPKVPATVAFRDGFVVALFNPKTTLFFSAFLPQFLEPGASTMRQSLFLGVLFVLIASTTDTLYAVAAGAVAPLFTRARGRVDVGRYVAGSAYIGLGVFTAASGSHHPK